MRNIKTKLIKENEYDKLLTLKNDLSFTQVNIENFFIKFLNKTLFEYENDLIILLQNHQFFDCIILSFLSKIDFIY